MWSVSIEMPSGTPPSTASARRSVSHTCPSKPPALSGRIHVTRFEGISSSGAPSSTGSFATRSRASATIASGTSALPKATLAIVLVSAPWLLLPATASAPTRCSRQLSSSACIAANISRPARTERNGTQSQL